MKHSSLCPSRFLVNARPTHAGGGCGTFPPGKATWFRRWRAGALLGVVVGAAPWAGAQIIGWDFAGSVGNEGSASATTLHAQLKPVALTRGAGIGAASYADSFAASGWPTSSTTLAAAQAGNEYFSFTVSPAVGSTVSLSSLGGTYGRTNNSSPNQFQWQYSLDGFATAGVNLGSVVAFNSNQTYGQSFSPIPLGGVSALQSVGAAQSVEFRLYVYGALSSPGLVHFGYLEGNDLFLAGTVSAIPEPATYACWVGLVALGGAILRRRAARRAVPAVTK